MCCKISHFKINTALLGSSEANKFLSSGQTPLMSRPERFTQGFLNGYHLAHQGRKFVLGWNWWRKAVDEKNFKFLFFAYLTRLVQMGISTVGKDKLP